MGHSIAVENHRESRTIRQNLSFDLRHNNPRHSGVSKSLINTICPFEHCPIPLTRIASQTIPKVTLFQTPQSVINRGLQHRRIPSMVHKYPVSDLGVSCDDPIFFAVFFFSPCHPTKGWYHRHTHLDIHMVFSSIEDAQPSSHSLNTPHSFSFHVGLAKVPHK